MDLMLAAAPEGLGAWWILIVPAGVAVFVLLILIGPAFGPWLQARFALIGLILDPEEMHTGRPDQCLHPAFKISPCAAIPGLGLEHIAGIRVMIRLFRLIVDTGFPGRHLAGIEHVFRFKRR